MTHGPTHGTDASKLRPARFHLRTARAPRSRNFFKKEPRHSEFFDCTTPHLYISKLVMLSITISQTRVFKKTLESIYWAVGQGVQRVLTEKHSADRKRKYCQNTSKIYSLSDIILQQNQKNSMQNLFLKLEPKFRFKILSIS